MPNHYLNVETNRSLCGAAAYTGIKAKVLKGWCPECVHIRKVNEAKEQAKVNS